VFLGNDDSDSRIYGSLWAAHTLGLEHRKKPNGPYTDTDGVVRVLIDHPVSRVPRDDIVTIADVLAGVLRPRLVVYDTTGRKTIEHGSSAFVLDNRFPTTHPPSTGLSLKERSAEHAGIRYIVQIHPLEQYLIAIAILRQFGHHAYLAEAIETVAQREVRRPLVAVVDFNKDPSLATFALSPSHPRAQLIDIIGDEAVLGATYAILAEATVNNFAIRLERGELTEAQFRAELNAIASPLFQAYLRWPGCHYINEALGYMRERITSALASAQLQEITAPMQRGSAILHATGFEEVVEPIRRRVMAEYVNPTIALVQEKIRRLEQT
jgi:hypothetical protein